MIKSHVIVIKEVDDDKLALDEFNKQLADVTLLKNTIGIVSVHPEFVSSGVYSAVAKTVNFPLVGMTTLSQTANGETGTYLFAIMILTSDDCEFAHGTSGEIPNGGDVTGDVSRECYKNVRAKLSGDVKLLLLYAPYIEGRCGYDYVKAISACDPKVPLFGSLANADMENLLNEMKTFCDDKYYNNRLSLLLISGNITPEFFIGAVTEDAAIMQDIGEVTAAHDNVVTEINHMNIDTFFDKLGYFVGEARNKGLLTSTFIVKEKDADGNVTSITTRGVLSLQDGACVFGGYVPKGAVLSLAATTKDVVISSAKDVASRIKSRHSGKTILMYSCIGRRYSLLDEPLKECEVLNEELAGFNYFAPCSCGEICPTSVTDNNVDNREHNQTLIACVL